MATVKQIDRIAGRTRAVQSVPENATVAEAAAKMADNQIGCMLVVNRLGELLGLFTERDLVREIVAKQVDPSRFKVSEIMVRDIVTCGPNTSVARVEELMFENGIRHVPIVDKGVPVGIVSSRDVLAYKLAYTEALVTQQTSVLRDVEARYPGVTGLQKDISGRVVL
jgi:CBS domain-containing protein